MTHDQIRKELHRLIQNERENTAKLLLAINAAAESRSYAVFGYTSLFKWLIGEFKLSNGAAARRLQAARLLRSVPAIEEKLTSGALNLTTLCQTQNKINAQEKATETKVPESTKVRLAEQIENKSSEETAEILFQSFPEAAPDATKPQNRKLKNHKTRCPLGFTDEEMKLLKRAKEVLSHQIPTGDFSKVVAYALKRVIKQMDPLEKRPAKRRSAAAAKTKPESSDRSAADQKSDEIQMRSGADQTAAGNHIQFATDQMADETQKPSAADLSQLERVSKAQIRREVFRANDGGCCFVGADGHFCNERSLVQTDHIVPLGVGGEDTFRNQRPLCRTHNLLEAERVYGKAHMDKFRRSNRDLNRSKAPFPNRG